MKRIAYAVKQSLLFSSLALGSAAAMADEIKFLCYQDSNECAVIEDLAKGFTAETGHTVVTETVGYDIIRDQLENQLQTDAAPDVARVTNLGGLNQYYLDLRPFVDNSDWKENYGTVLGWFQRPDGSDNGIYGWLTGLTMTGPYVNVTMFEDAGVDMPGAGATWDDWMAALAEVKDTLGLNAAMAMDRTAHRWAGPAFSYGAGFFDADNQPILVDQGFRDFATKFVGWHEQGLMPAEGWPAGSGTQYRNAAPLFVGGEVAMHMSGSWMINNYDSNIKDFEWKAVPAPCGPGGCGAMPGGAAVVAFKSSQHPEAAAAFVDYLARTEKAEQFAAQTKSIPGHKGLQESGIDYPGVSPAVADSLSVFASNAAVAGDTTPQAYTFQGYNKNFVIYGVVPDYITKAITGEMSLDDALTAIDADVAAKIAE